MLGMLGTARFYVPIAQSTLEYPALHTHDPPSHEPWEEQDPR